MTATAVRVIELEKDRQGRLIEDSKDEINSYFESIKDPRKRNKVGYVVGAFGQQNKLANQIKKLRSQAKKNGLESIVINKYGKDKVKNQTIMFDPKNRGAVKGASQTLRTILKDAPRKISDQKKREFAKKIGADYKSISKKKPKKGNTTRTAKNKNIKGIGTTPKRVISKKDKPKYFIEP